MSKNVKVNDTTYSGIYTVELPLSDGSGNAQFKDVDEIATPSGSIEITENGTHDVTNYASAVVNVASGGGGISPVLIASAASYQTDPDTSESIPNGRLAFKNIPLKPKTVYYIESTTSPNDGKTFVYMSLVSSTVLSADRLLVGFGATKGGTVISVSVGNVVDNSDGTYNFTTSGTGSYRFYEALTYNLYEYCTIATE